MALAEDHRTAAQRPCDRMEEEVRRPPAMCSGWRFGTFVAGLLARCPALDYPEAPAERCQRRTGTATEAGSRIMRHTLSPTPWILNPKA